MLEEMYKSQSRMVSSVLDMRKIPLFDVFRPFQRMVRDLCQSLKKDVQLKVNGEGLRVDTSLGKVIGDSLVHLIRNSLDHGIEEAEARRRSGKSATGMVSVNCYEAKEEVIIEVADDGGGMNVNAIRDKAIERQLISTEEARTLSDGHIMQLVFEPGFSTAKQVTDVSGRGVGMDMVKSSVDAIGGHVDVSSERGKGSRFQLRLPVPKSVMIINVILVREADKTFAFPQDRIEHLLQFDRSRKSDHIREMQDTRLLVRDGKLIPLIRLRDVLHLDEGHSHPADEVSVVIVKDERVHYAIEVDTILDSEEVVVKPLSNVLGGLNCYLGATLVGVGDVCVIINYEGLAAMAGVETQSLSEAKEKAAISELVEATTESDFVLFRFAHSDSVYASPCESIYRLEHIAPRDIQWSGGTPVFEYRGRIMPIIDTARELGFEPMLADRSIPEDTRDVPLLVVNKADAYFGFCVAEFVDVLFVTQEVDYMVQDRKGIEGNLTLSGVNYPVIHLESLLPEKMVSALAQVEKPNSQASAAPPRAADGKSDGSKNDDGIIWVS
jgi:two-component system chemotaxis sensor kinase CheA